MIVLFFFFQAEDGIRDLTVTGVQTCALPISGRRNPATRRSVVVLPQPDGPRSETSSPGSTRRSSPSSAARSPYRFVSPLIVTPGMGSRSVLRADNVATEQRLHHDDGGEGHAEP